MAQNYEIDIKRFNGQDYDTLLPTPAAHASTHQADGSDPLTLQTGNYGDSSIPTSAYQDSSVTRAKLARDALYSPFTNVKADYTVGASDLGKTLLISNSKEATITVTLDDNAANSLPSGSEIAFYVHDKNPRYLKFSGTLVVNHVDGTIKAGSATSATVRIPQFGMVAIKKIYTTVWVLTGNVEVVS